MQPVTQPISAPTLVDPEIAKYEEVGSVFAQ